MRIKQRTIAAFFNALFLLQTITSNADECGKNVLTIKVSWHFVSIQNVGQVMVKKGTIIFYDTKSCMTSKWLGLKLHGHILNIDTYRVMKLVMRMRYNGEQDGDVRQWVKILFSCSSDNKVPWLDNSACNKSLTFLALFIPSRTTDGHGLKKWSQILENHVIKIILITWHHGLCLSFHVCLHSDSNIILVYHVPHYFLSKLLVTLFLSH